MERAGGRAGTEGGSEEDELVIVDDDAAAIVAAGAAAAVPRSQGLGGDAIAVPAVDDDKLRGAARLRFLFEITRVFKYSVRIQASRSGIQI